MANYSVILVGMLRDGTASNMNGINSEFTDSLVLEGSNLPSVMHYDDLYKTKTNELCDQSDAMADFLISLVRLHLIIMVGYHYYR